MYNFTFRMIDAMGDRYTITIKANSYKKAKQLALVGGYCLVDYLIKKEKLK